MQTRALVAMITATLLATGVARALPAQQPTLSAEERRDVAPNPSMTRSSHPSKGKGASSESQSVPARTQA